jgi:cardiolipin synthase A/B
MELWPYAAAATNLLLSLGAAAHAILYKRDARAAITWVGLIWLVPILGALLYIWLGINRIKRRAHTLRERVPQLKQIPISSIDPREVGEESLTDGALRSLALLVGNVSRKPLIAGNRITPLINGDQAFPAMLQAIESAKDSVALSSYIFDNDRVGALFIDALKRAVDRGVAVRVLVDDVGTRYTWPTVKGPLRRAGIPFTTFMPTLIPWRLRYSNLRNHRKILVVDGRTGFTGGINVREGSYHKLDPPHPIQDLHFQLEGPIVRQLQQVFAEDWAFAMGEMLEGDIWFRDIEPQAGGLLARGVPDGPDDDFDVIRMTFLGAIACARSKVQIVTPYFLPDAALITSLNVAVLRGVAVEIILPERNNLRMVQWASTALLWQVLQRGCRVWLSPPPFDHTKLMLVDDTWSFIGSSNWDPRSLRLNFELNVECYDADLARTLDRLVTEKRNHSREITLADVDSRSLPVRLRDGVARLFSPYL